jgi:type II secretory pathway pseudopilin PulG
MPPFQAARRALTLLEIVVSTLIVGLMTVAALNTLGAATQSGQAAGNRAIALGLADDLMAEILQKAYRNPDGSAQFGPESGETDPTDFDDVDDYHNWVEQPPRTRNDLDNNGQLDPIPNRAEWSRRVLVRHVDPNVNPTHPNWILSNNNDQGVKRIEVIVDHQDHPIASQVAFCTDTD